MRRKRARELVTLGLMFASALIVATTISACAQATGASGAEPRSLSVKIDVEGTCPKRPGSIGCWTTPTSKPDCYIWITDYPQDRKMDWDGNCSGGFAQGAGHVTWYAPRRQGQVITFKRRREPGERTGLKSVSLNSDIWVEQGELKDGRKEGHWLDGRGIDVKAAGSYENGLRTGHWQETGPGAATSEGPYLRGERHGIWSQHDEDGTVWEGRYLDGLKHGIWRAFRGGRYIGQLTFVGGKQEPD